MPADATRPPRPAVLESADYEATRLRLLDDPVILSMADGLNGHPLADLAHDDLTPRHDFMLAANRRYAQIGGRVTGHLGAVAEALLRIRALPGYGPMIATATGVTDPAAVAAIEATMRTARPVLDGLDRAHFRALARAAAANAELDTEGTNPR